MRKGLDYIGVGVGGVITRNNGMEVLLLLRKKSPEKNCWTIPGGSVEIGETLSSAISREAYEELGVKVDVVRLLRVTDHIVVEEGVHWVSPAFELHITEGEPNNIEVDSHEKIQWFDIKKLPENITITTKKAIESLVIRSEKIVYD